MKNFITKTVLFFALIVASLTSFATTNFSNCVTSVNEVITERGSNCYSAMLQYREKFKDAPLSYYAIGIAAIATLFTNFDIAFLFDSGVTLAPVVAVAWINKDEQFVKLDSEGIEKLTPEELPEYQNALSENNQKQEEAIGKKLIELGEDSVANKAEIEALKSELNGVNIDMVKEMMASVKAIAVEQQKMKDSGEGSDSSLKTVMKSAWDKEITNLKEAMESKNGVHEFAIKATQTYGDITDGEDFAQMKPGITDIVVRRPKIRELFGVIPVNTEFLKYVEQNTVVRDAKNVAKCAAAATNTKETIIVRDIQTKVVKDQIEFCRLFIADYPFMESRINKLINQSLALRIDEQLLLGDGAGENLNSIDSTASTFNAANAACDIATSIQAATYVDLILGMETQIIELGEQDSYEPNVVLVNKCDWFIFVQSRKDLNNNYLDARVTMVNGVPFVGGMMVVWTPIVPQNELYVFDSNRGEIVDRQSLTLEVAFENKDNWEKEIASLKGFERLNFLVENNNANAFMHAPDVAAGITAITSV